MKGRIETGWDSYLEQVVPKDSSEEQITECKRAFFAGASTALVEVTMLSILPETTGVIGLQMMHEEVKQFARDTVKRIFDAEKA